MIRGEASILNVDDGKINLFLMLDFYKKILLKIYILCQCWIGLKPGFGYLV